MQVERNFRQFCLFFSLTSCDGCGLLYTTGGAECCGTTLAFGNTECSLLGTAAAATEGYVC